MSAPGWYPDPGNRPGHYRYWDGNTWSATTVTDPAQPAPTASGATDGPLRRSRAEVVVGVLALVVVLAVVGVAASRTLLRAGPLDVPAPPAPTVSGWDDSSPSPSRAGEPRPGQARCPMGAPDVRSAHPVDGRVYGGRMSFAQVSSFAPATQENRLSFAHDVAQQTLVVNAEPAWMAQLAVGQLLTSDGFSGSARSTAETVVLCALNSNMYEPYDASQKTLRSQRVTVSGHDGWKIEADITVDQPDLPFGGDHVAFVVVRDGGDWGLFFGAVPIGNAALEQVLTDTVADLRFG